MSSIEIIFLLFLCNIFYLNCDMLKFIPRWRQNSSLQVNLPQGTVQGSLKQTMNQKLYYYSFEGIPYAQPPVDNLRFKPPAPAKNWIGILDTTKQYSPSCIQSTPTALENFEESEDCLYINVFTPNIHSIMNNTLPVMVWIHGGAFLIGTADSSYFGPDNLLEENIIVVHFSYRLGAFGFLSTEDLESPGNYGLKDQHLALQWVKNNIQYFGGDSNRITIFGESAGSASVQYQLIYPKNQDLFHGVISESGSILCIWAYQRYPRKIAFDVGAAAGIYTDNSKQLIKKLQNLSAEKLKIASFKALLKNSLAILNGIPFSPTIEPDHDDAFFTEKLHQLLVEGKFLKLPYIIGFNGDEASISKPVFDLLNPMLGILKLDPSILVPSGMNSGKAMREVGKKIKSVYFQDSQSASKQYLNYINDEYFFRPIIESARLFGIFTPTYMYSFNYEGLLGRQMIGYSKEDQYKGVVHTEEMAYIWARKPDSVEFSEMDKLVRARVVKLWTNFAKTGNPTPQEDPILENIIWPAVSNDMSYLDINRSLSIRQNFRSKSMEFWKELYKNYGNPPYDTY